MSIIMIKVTCSCRLLCCSALSEIHQTLFVLVGNDISKIEGLEGLQELRELVLDRNKVKAIGEYSFMNQWNLAELHLEENRLKDLANLENLENLQRLFLGVNRIQV